MSPAVNELWEELEIQLSVAYGEKECERKRNAMNHLWRNSVKDVRILRGGLSHFSKGKVKH